MADKKEITIVKGDSTGFGGRKLVTINCVSSVWDMSSLKAKFILHGIEQDFNDLTQPFDVNYTKDQTDAFPLGHDYAILRFENQAGERVTADNTIPVNVINYVSGNAIATDSYTLNLEIKDGDEIVMEVLVEAAVTLELGEVETLSAGSQAYIENVGTENHQIWNVGIPQGEKGEKGDVGPQGDRGPQGEQGPAGKDGSDAEVTQQNVLEALGFTPQPAGNYVTTDTEQTITASKILSDSTPLVFGGGKTGGELVCDSAGLYWASYD